MPDPLEGLSREELIDYCKALLSGAIDRLGMDMPEQAAWRIANALGALSCVLDNAGNFPGITTKTNLGYKLEIVNDNPKQTPEAERSG